MAVRSLFTSLLFGSSHPIFLLSTLQYLICESGHGGGPLFNFVCWLLAPTFFLSAISSIFYPLCLLRRPAAMDPQVIPIQVIALSFWFSAGCCMMDPILGSRRPSVEAFYAACTSKRHLVLLLGRFHVCMFPTVWNGFRSGRPSGSGRKE